MIASTIVAAAMVATVVPAPIIPAMMTTVISAPVSETKRKPWITPVPAVVRPRIIIAVDWRIDVERCRFGIDGCRLDVIGRGLSCGEHVLRAAVICPHRWLRGRRELRLGLRGSCLRVLLLVEHGGQYLIGHALLA